MPLTDCPKQGDPLAERPPPKVETTCQPNNFQGTTRTIRPGTYCGGLNIGKGAKITLDPGVYVIKDGPLIVGPGSTSSGDDDDDGGSYASNTGFMKGNGVGFYFTGTVAGSKGAAPLVMRFEKNSVVELTAPLTGDMNGLLFHEDRTSPADRSFEVLSDSARRLVGTIYLPRGTFKVDATQTVADQSEYTAIVTKRLQLSKAPNLVLNNRYGDTNVPVPDGIGNKSGKLILID